MQAFKRVLKLTWNKIREAEEAKQFNSFKDFWIIAFYFCYLYGFKNVQKVNEMTLKLLFYCCKITSFDQQMGALPPGLSVIRLSCISLFSTGPKLHNFSCEKNSLLFQALFSEESPGCAFGRIHCRRQIFQAIIWAAHETSWETLLVLYVSFLRHECKIAKIAHNF